MSSRACSGVSMPSVAQVSRPSALHLADHRRDLLELPSASGCGRRRPCRSGSRRSPCARRAASSTSLHVQQLLALEPGVVADALRAVGAVLRAGAGLDRQQRAHLHAVRVEVRAVHALGVEQQVVERQREQRARLARASSRCGRSPRRSRSGVVMANPDEMSAGDGAATAGRADADAAAGQYSDRGTGCQPMRRMGLHGRRSLAGWCAAAPVRPVRRPGQPPALDLCARLRVESRCRPCRAVAARAADPAGQAGARRGRSQRMRACRRSTTSCAPRGPTSSRWAGAGTQVRRCARQCRVFGTLLGSAGAASTR